MNECCIARTQDWACSVPDRITWTVILLHYLEHKSPPDIFQWEIDLVGFRIDDDHMCVVAKETFPDFSHATGQVENGNDALFPCNVKAMQPWVERQNVRILPDLERSGDFHCTHVQGQQPVVVLTCHKCEAVMRIDQ